MVVQGLHMQHISPAKRARCCRLLARVSADITKMKRKEVIGKSLQTSSFNQEQKARALPLISNHHHHDHYVRALPTYAVSARSQP